MKHVKILVAGIPGPGAMDNDDQRLAMLADRVGEDVPVARLYVYLMDLIQLFAEVGLFLGLDFVHCGWYYYAMCG